MSEKQYSKKFEYYKERYIRNGCTKEQLSKLVELNVLQNWEYEEIVIAQSELVK